MAPHEYNPVFVFIVGVLFIAGMDGVRGTPVVFLTRVETFSAAHRLNSNALSAEENAEVYGKCNRPNSHGHNYKVEVTVKGKVDQRTGMVMNINDLKSCMKLAIMDVLDHNNLDKDVPYFKDKVSTTENLAVFVWESLCHHMPRKLLHSVKIYETEKNIVTFFGDFS